MRPRILSLLPLAMLAAPASARAQAVQPYGVPAVGHADYYGYGYAVPPVRRTRFPRPSELVPAPWSYGTYGVPTVTGIPASPVARPTLTVITGTSARDRRIAAEDGFRAGAQIIQVQVPRR